QMYALATTLDPDGLFRIARATFAEMALAGITVVGEFHYVHHAPDGRPYADPNETGRAMLAAAAEAGIRITLLDACYLHGVIDLFEEARAIELDERLVTGVRGHHAATSLLEAATAGGYGCLGWGDGGRIAVGGLADLAAVTLDSVRTAGTPPEALVFSAGAA